MELVCTDILFLCIIFVYFRFKLNLSSPLKLPSPKRSSFWPDDYLPDLPPSPSDEDTQSAQSGTFTDAEDVKDDQADNDTTLVISTDDEDGQEVPTLEPPSDDANVSDKSDESTDSEIPTGYNSETGELYQNQESDPVVREKMRRQFI